MLIETIPILNYDVTFMAGLVSVLCLCCNDMQILGVTPEVIIIAVLRKLEAGDALVHILTLADS